MIIKLLTTNYDYPNFQKIINYQKKIKLSTNMLLITIKNKHINVAIILINHVNATSECLEVCLCNDSDDLINLIISQKIQLIKHLLM